MTAWPTFYSIDLVRIEFSQGQFSYWLSNNLKYLIRGDICFKCWPSHAHDAQPSINYSSPIQVIQSTSPGTVCTTQKMKDSYFRFASYSPTHKGCAHACLLLPSGYCVHVRLLEHTTNLIVYMPWRALLKDYPIARIASTTESGHLHAMISNHSLQILGGCHKRVGSIDSPHWFSVERSFG